MRRKRMPDSREPGLGMYVKSKSGSAVTSTVLLLLLITASLPILSQEPPRGTIRVEVRTDDGPIAGAVVNINGISAPTDQSGVATLAVPLGMAEIVVTKEGFFPGKASLLVSEAREWQITID